MASTDQNLIALQPGTVIAGRYEVVKCLGAGSMGLVYACRHRELSGHLVAVKVLFPEVAKDSVAAARFRNEIVASYGVSHPNVVRAYEYFRDGDLVAYTMEYVGGGDLADVLANGELMAIPRIVKLLSQISSGVQAIHDAGIVHRDLKPENILLTPDGDVKITDFGIARTGHGPKLTEHGGVVGTIDYVSPEYLEKGQVDARSDIYALGVLGYEMISGQSPFQGDSVIATMTMRLRSDPKPPIDLRPDCPSKLNDVIVRAMERNPDLRYQSTMEIYHDLQELGAVPIKPAPAPAKKQVAPKAAPESAQVQSEPKYVQEEVVPTQELQTTDPIIEEIVQRVPVSVREEESAQTTDMILSHPSIDEVNQQFRPDFSSRSGKLESVLRIEDTENNVERVLRNSAPISVSQSGLDKGRIRTLSQAVNRTQRNNWMFDILWILLAIIVGIAVGLFALKIIWPDFFDKKVSFVDGYDFSLNISNDEFN